MSAGDTSESWFRYVLRWPTSTSRDWALRTLPELCANPNVLAVVLLGSTIRPADDSYDLDCLYVFRGQRAVLRNVPADVDVRGFESQQVSSLVRDGNDLLVWSLTLGQLVCEREKFWTRLRAEWHGRVPFPSAEVAESRAEKAEQLLADLREVGDHDATVEQLVTALTHRARAALLRRGVFPASRPELPQQLRAIAESRLADALEAAIRERSALAHSSAVRG
jgi:hypothetical protein